MKHTSKENKKTKICPYGFHSNQESECDCGEKINNSEPFIFKEDIELYEKQPTKQ